MQMNHWQRAGLWTVLICFGAVGSAVAAQKHGGLAASYVAPTDDLEDVSGDGYAITAIFDYPMAGIVNVTGSAGMYKFSGTTLLEGTNLKSASQTVWEFAAGPQLDFGLLYAGFEAGYYTKLNEWGLVPNIGVRKDMVDLGFRYKVTGDGTFYSARLGLFF